jgi:hypothetical protein
MGIPHELFEEKLEAMKIEKGLRNDTELSVRDLEELFFLRRRIWKNLYLNIRMFTQWLKANNFPQVL